MSSQPQPLWSLSDEEWCELCFLVVELGDAQQHLQDILLANERPSLHQLWCASRAYQQRSQALFEYLSQRLRERALVGEGRAA